MSKRKILMSFAALCMLSTAAVAEGPKAGGVVNAVIQPEPPSLMVGLVQNGPTQMVAGKAAAQHGLECPHEQRIERRRSVASQLPRFIHYAEREQSLVHQRGDPAFRPAS